MKTKLILLSTLFFANYVFAQNFSKTASIGSDGGMEIGKYIDFHSTDAGTSDYDVRLLADPAKLTLTGGTLFLQNTEIVSGWAYTHLQWPGQSLVMGSPVGNYMHNRIELKPGGSSLGQCESELYLYDTKTDLTSELKVKFATSGNSYILGNLGVNTTTPSCSLDVNGNIGGSNDLILGSNNKQFILHTQQQFPSNPPILIFAPKKSDGSEFDWTKQISFKDDGSLLMSSGNLGVGTTTPQAKLDVNGNTAVEGDLLLGKDENTSTISGPTNSGAIQIKSDYANSGYTNRYIRLGWRDNNDVFSPALSIIDNLNVGIGTTNPQYPLDVYGTIRAREVLVNLNGTADFVFKDNYKLKPIQEVYEYAKENKHLPDVPSEAEVVKNGMNMGEFQVKLLQKVEELTLYMAQQDKTIQAQQAKIKELEEKFNK